MTIDEHVTTFRTIESLLSNNVKQVLFANKVVSSLLAWGRSLM